MNIIPSVFNTIMLERRLRGGGLLLMTAQRQPDGGLRILEIKFYPKREAQDIDAELLAA